MNSLPFKISPCIVYSVGTKILVPLCLILGLTVAVSSIGLYTFLRNGFVEHAKDAANSSSEIIKESIESAMLKNRRDEVQQIISHIGHLKEIKRVAIYTKEGRVFVSTDKFDEGKIIKNRKTNKNCAVCHQKKVSNRCATIVMADPVSPKVSIFRNVNLILNKKPCQRCHATKEKYLAMLAIDISMNKTNAMVKETFKRLILTATVAIVFVIITVYSIINILVKKPVRELVRATKKVGSGDFSQTIAVRGQDEISQVADAFNKMTVNLKEHIKEVERKSCRIEELIELKAEIESINSKLQQKILALYALHEISKAVNSTLELDRLFYVVMDMVSNTLGIKDFCLMLLNEEEQRLEIKAAYGLPQEVQDKISFAVGEGVSGTVVKTGKSQIIGDVSKVPEFKYYHGEKTDIKSFLCIPLMVRGKAVGVLNVNHTKENAFSGDDMALFTAVANQIAIAIENAKLFELTKKMSVTDSLTGLYNHGFFQKQLSEELERARRYRRNVSLLMIDVDRFKKINDKYGHTVGDRILQAVADMFKMYSRHVDTVARYGGEEFAIILPETDGEQAKIVAERLRKDVEKMEIYVEELEKNLKTTISIGISSYPANALTQEELIESADKALYRAKLTGRNRVK